jgi:hypothetical protein
MRKFYRKDLIGNIVEIKDPVAIQMLRRTDTKVKRRKGKDES